MLLVLDYGEDLGAINCWITKMIIMSSIVVMCSINYANVYRDEEITKLNKQVEAGVWKGCYTTELRARGIVGLEDFLSQYTNKEEKILILDWASFGYLMVRGKSFTPTTLDSMVYSCGVNDPDVMYKYFKLKGDVPDKIIYIHYYKDRDVSINDRDWKFNEFVKENYQHGSDYDNGVFRVQVYLLGDRVKALDCVDLVGANNKKSVVNFL